MTEVMVNIRCKDGLVSVRSFPSRAAVWAVTESWGMAPLHSVTHVNTGYRCGDGLDLRVAEILAVIFDRILPGQTVEEVTASFVALPQQVRVWVLACRKGWR